MFEYEVKIETVQRPDFDHDGLVEVSIPNTPPSLTKMLVLAHQIHRAVESSQITDFAEIARQIGVTRARVSQIVKLRCVAPAIQEIILCQPERVAHLFERQIRHLLCLTDPQTQLKQFELLLNLNR